jgi:beta-galactosidase GanA
MKQRIGIIGIMLALLVPALWGCEQAAAPHLIKQGTATQLVVQGEPFLMLGGELGNSTASALGELDKVFATLHETGLNTVLTPAYWELIEPAEGTFDFASIDAAIKAARRHHLKVVFLWFGAWKNSMSCYAPLWVKRDYAKYPRSVSQSGRPLEIMSPFAQSNIDADCSAFAALLAHIAAVDAKEQTVVMVQVENEIGMIPDARDYSEEATAKFHSAVPQPLLDYLTANKATLRPQLLSQWAAAGFRTEGTWPEVFGQGLETDELFMAWHYGLFVESVAHAGKQAYALPMYLNAALNSRGRKPGAYPSAGPLAHLLDVWRAAAPSIDFLAPDIYDPGFTDWCAQYAVDGNPLFIPEIRLSDEDAARVFYAFGEHDAMGFSPFSIENIPNHAVSPLSKSYGVLQQLLPLLAAAQGKGTSCGFLFDGVNKERTVRLGSYNVTGRHLYTYGWAAQARDGSPWAEVGVLVLQLSDREFLVAGTGVAVTFTNALNDGMVTGIGAIDKVSLVNGKMVPSARMNGDESHQGRHLRIGVGEWEIQHITLYGYKGE